LTYSKIKKYRWFQKLKNGEKLDVVNVARANKIRDDLEYRYWLNGTTSKQYLDYVE
jgi:hypothetical protein